MPRTDMVLTFELMKHQPNMNYVCIIIERNDWDENEMTHS